MKERELFDSCDSSGSARRVCVRCGRSLPLESFYRTGPARRPDAYCKACRRELASRCRARRSMERVSEVFRLRRRPLITTTDDPVLRKRLLLEALSFVKESKQRRRMKSARREDERIDREIDREEQEALRREQTRCSVKEEMRSVEEEMRSVEEEMRSVEEEICSADSEKCGSDPEKGENRQPDEEERRGHGTGR